MHITKALLEQFLQNKCSSEESAQVYQYLLKHPQALDELLSMEEWENFEPHEQLPQPTSQAWWAQIQEQKQPAVVAIPWRRWLQVAAALVMVVGTMVYLVTGHRQPPTVANTTTPPAAGGSMHAGARKLLINNGHRPVIDTLSDGSIVTLYAHSIMECMQPFEAGKRDIVLHGEALFRVAKDKSRPFTVFTDNFSTTALGTVFRVSAYNNKTISGIQLISGRVVVKNLQLAAEPVYLQPGDECLFNTNDKKLALHTGKPVPPAVKAALHHQAAVTETEDVVIFSNAPLQQVCDRISALCHMAIQVNLAHPEQRKFTGTLMKSESPAELLNTIASLNNLKVTQHEGGYVLSEP
jgi:ferric-dicitrate binding protein FerR (iron transport regulator)